MLRGNQFARLDEIKVYYFVQTERSLITNADNRSINISHDIKWHEKQMKLACLRVRVYMLHYTHL